MVARRSGELVPAVAYLRTSTVDQLNGIDAQNETVGRLAEAKRWRVVKTFTEHESGGDQARVELDKAIRHARRIRAVLVVAFLDRLARDSRFLMRLYDGDVPVAFGDFPECDGSAASRFMITVLAAAAEFQRRRLSENTKAAMAAMKARGARFGTPANLSHEARVRGSRTAAVKRVQKAIDDQADIAQIAARMRASGSTLRQIAEALEAEGYPTRLGGSSWSPVQVKRVLDRLKP
jgi:DNA invertase Pin-like site-specific DNA recombinase